VWGIKKGNTMTRTLAIIAATATLAACVPSTEMIDRQRNACAQIGYAAGSPDFLACVERGVAQGQAAQNATGAAIASGAANMIIANALWGG
jgi:hypothetical protein